MADDATISPALQETVMRTITVVTKIPYVEGKSMRFAESDR